MTVEVCASASELHVLLSEVTAAVAEGTTLGVEVTSQRCSGRAGRTACRPDGWKVKAGPGGCTGVRPRWPIQSLAFLSHWGHTSWAASSSSFRLGWPRAWGETGERELGFLRGGPPTGCLASALLFQLRFRGPCPRGAASRTPPEQVPRGSSSTAGTWTPLPAPCSLGPSSPGVCGSRKLSPRRPLSPFVCSSKQKKHIHLCHQDPVLSPRDELTVVSVSCLPCDLYEG